jgi:hypothetical protein
MFECLLIVALHAAVVVTIEYFKNDNDPPDPPHMCA